MGARREQEGGELRLRHLAGRHGELAVLDGAVAADVVLDRDVVGWIGEDDVGLFVLEEERVGRRLQRGPAGQSMPIQYPDITRLGHRWAGRRRDFVGGVLAFRLRHIEGPDADVDLRRIEAGELCQFDVELEFEEGELLQRLAEQLVVPSSDLAETIVGDLKGPRLLWSQMRK